MAVIKNILFDLGGVLLNLDIGRTDAAFAALIGDWSEHRKIYKALIDSHLFEQFEIGAVDESTFVGTIRRHAPLPTNEKQIRLAWSAMLLDLPKTRLDMLGRLREKGYRLFLLSNTNSIHLADFYDIVEQQHQINFDALFDKTYYSHLIGQRKPYADTYRFVMEDAGIEARETLFIDDNAPNIQGAASAGLHVLLHQANGDIEGALNHFLLMHNNKENS